MKKLSREKQIRKQRNAIGDAKTACDLVIDGKKPEGYQLPFLERMRRVLEETNK